VLSLSLQVVINGSQVHWTLDTEVLIREKGNEGVHEYYHQLVSQLNDMVYLIRGKLSKMARITIGALAVIDVHARDVMKSMAEAGVSKVRTILHSPASCIHLCVRGRPWAVLACVHLSPCVGYAWVGEGLP
jgi:hypothetical protein